MNAQMRLPNVHDFALVAGAADMLGVSPLTVKRYIKAGTLTPYWPRGARQDNVRDVLLSTAEVEQLKQARKITGRASA